MLVLLFLVFAVAALAASAAAVTGRRGQVCVRGVGYPVPARVEADPGLVRRANELVATWCTAAAVLSCLPLLALAATGLRSDVEPPLAALIALAGYGFLVVCVGGYPFERIRRLGGDGSSQLSWP